MGSSVGFFHAVRLRSPGVSQRVQVHVWPILSTGWNCTCSQVPHWRTKPRRSTPARSTMSSWLRSSSTSRIRYAVAEAGEAQHAFTDRERYAIVVRICFPACRGGREEVVECGQEGTAEQVHELVLSA